MKNYFIVIKNCIEHKIDSDCVFTSYSKARKKALHIVKNINEELHNTMHNEQKHPMFVSEYCPDFWANDKHIIEIKMRRSKPAIHKS